MPVRPSSWSIKSKNTKRSKYEKDYLLTPGDAVYGVLTEDTGASSDSPDLSIGGVDAGGTLRTSRYFILSAQDTMIGILGRYAVY